LQIQIEKEDQENQINEIENSIQILESLEDSITEEEYRTLKEQQDVAKKILYNFKKKRKKKRKEMKRLKKIKKYMNRKLKNNQRNIWIPVFATPKELINRKDMVDELENGKYKIFDVKHNISSTNVNTIQTYQKKRAEEFQYVFVEEQDLSEEESKVWNRRYEILELVDEAKFKYGIRLSETLRKVDEFDTVGVWDNGSIIIKRSQLNKFSSFAGTLLHELAHAISKASDISRQFENKLTLYLGLVASKCLKEEEKKIEKKRLRIDEDESKESESMENVESMEGSKIVSKKPESMELDDELDDDFENN